MNHLVSDLDIEDIKPSHLPTRRARRSTHATFSEAVDWLDSFVDNEEDGDKLRMLWALQGLKDLLHDATAGAAKMDISPSLLAIGSGCSIG